MAAPKGHAAYNKNGEGGRPVKYTKEVIEKYADEFEIWLEDDNNFWFKDFAIKHKFDAKLLQVWAKDNHRFSEVLQQAKQKQESKLFKSALINTFNPGIVKFALNVHHSWIEKKETVHTNNPNNPVPEWIMNTEGTSKDLVSDERES
jgi:hypothetical protein